MKLKLLLLSLMALSPFCQKISAQAGSFELHLDAGYGFPVAQSYFYSNTGTEQTVVPYSLGSGLDLDFGATYMIGDHLGIGLDITDIMGTEVHYTSIGTNVVRDNAYSGMLIGVTPMIVLSANKEGINPYGKFGLVMGSGSVTYSETESGERAHSGTYIDTYSGGSAIGVYGAFGLQFYLTDNLGIFAEIYGRAISYAPMTLTNTQAFDGDQKLSTVTFMDQKDNTSASDTELKSYWPFSSAGIKVGIYINLGK